MSSSRSRTAAALATIARLTEPPRLDETHPVAGRFIYAMRLIAVHDRARRDPVPELAMRLGSVDVAAKALILAHTVSASWPEDIHISRFCCGFMSHDEATIGAFVGAAANGDRVGFEAALTGLVRPDRMHRLWEGALALTAAEMRCL